MPEDVALDEDEVAWLKSYAAEVRKTFGAEFRGAEDRFARWKPLLRRFTKLLITS